PLTTVDNEVETKLGQQISQLPGVAQVLYGGQQKPAIRVQLDPSKMAVRGLTLEDVRTQLNGVTENDPTGNIDGPSRSYTIYTNGQLTDASKWNDVIVTYQNGSPLYIRDIGQAVSAAQDSKQAAWANGKRGIFLIIFKQPGANVIQTVDSITAELPRLTASMLPGIKIGVLSDRTQTIRAAVSDVRTTLLITVMLVVAVIFVFLRSVRATLIPSLTVPLALFGACAMMWIAGFTLDNLSLMALTIAVGFVVDDAIVVLENIQRHIDEGMDGFEAAMTGAGEIGFTILSISLSLVAVLLPLLLMSGIIGRLFREFSLTLTMTIAVSAFVSLTLIPMLASRFL
ncbi:acriflavine resistance protein B, partial [Nostoc sp. 3335mG]